MRKKGIKKAGSCPALGCASFKLIWHLPCKKGITEQISGFAAYANFKCDFCALHSPGHQFPFKNKIFSVDSTTITLAAAVFKWAVYRNSTKDIKIHIVLDHDGHISAFATISDGKTHDCKFLAAPELPKGSFVIDDRVYSAPK